MSAALSSEEAIGEAWARLKQGRPAREALALVEPIAADDPQFGQALHVRGVCAARERDLARAKDLFLAAIARGARSRPLWLHLTRVAAELGFPDDALSPLLELVQRVPTPKLYPLASDMLQTMGALNKEPHPKKDAAFGKLLMPILASLLERRAMNGAMALEGVLYEHFVKPNETEAHFAWCMEQMAPLFTKAAHAWRRDLPPLPQPSLEPPYRVGFFIHSASMLAHIEVLLNTLKGYRMLDEQPFEPTVYCFSGKHRALEEALERLNVRLVMLNERFPETSSWQRMLRFRELLSEEGVQELVWVSLVTMLPLAFGLRVAPVQTWLAMKYRNFSQEDIDGYVTGSALTRFGTLAGRRWRMATLGVDDWYDPSLEDQAALIRASFEGRPILMTLARTEKMQEPAYLRAVAAILRAHPEAVFLWAGREESPKVVRAFKAAGVLDRTRFLGWVNTRLFAQVADVFLDSFPHPCGFTLYQAMAAGKPVVIYDSPEAVQTGLWGFLKPLLEDGEGAPEEREALRAFVGGEAEPLISLARTPEDYVRLAGRLLADEPARAAAGAASRGFIARYFSDPRVLGSTMAQHFVELIEEGRAAGPT